MGSMSCPNATLTASLIPERESGNVSDTKACLQSFPNPVFYQGVVEVLGIVLARSIRESGIVTLAA